MQSCVTPPFPCSACSVRGLVCRTVDQDVAANDPFYLPHPEALAPSSVSWSASSDLLNSRHAVASIANEGSYRPSLVPPPGLVRLQHRFSTDFGGRYVKKVWGKLFQKWDALPDKAYSSHVPTLTSVPPLIDSGEPSVSTKRDRWERDPMPSFSPDPFFNANLVRTQLTTGSPSQDTAYGTLTVFVGWWYSFP